MQVYGLFENSHYCVWHFCGLECGQGQRGVEKEDRKVKLAQPCKNKFAFRQWVAIKAGKWGMIVL